MSEDIKKNFVQVNYDLLATKKLNSTQKLFISYIIGWQKNKLICKETNNNLASKFGMTYSGIRTVIHDLNKHNFFNAVQKDYNEENGTSGHEITVNEAKLKLFLNDGKVLKVNNSINTRANDQANKNSINEIENKIESEDIPSIIQYKYSDIINLKDTLIYLGFSNDEIDIFRAKIKSENVTFDDLAYVISGINLAQKQDSYVGLRISEEQYNLYQKMNLGED